MDPMDLAKSIVSALTQYLAELASGVVDRVADKTGDNLYQLLSSRLQVNRPALDTLESLRKNPDNAVSKEGLIFALAFEIKRDPDFGNVLKRLLGDDTQPTATTSGDVNISNTRRIKDTVFATGHAKVDQSRHFSFRSGGGLRLAIAAAVLLTGGVTTTIIVEANTPTFPELEGNWNRQVDGALEALHFTNDTFALDAFGTGIGNAGAQIHCTGKVSREKGGTYTLVTSQGACPTIKATVAGDGKTLRTKIEGDDIIGTFTFVKGT